MSTPTVPAARFGRSLARLRRFQDKATVEDLVGAIPEIIDFRDIPAINISAYPNASPIGEPSKVGETWFGGINKTSGGTMTLNASSGIKFGSSWVTSIVFTGAGSWAYMIAIKYLDNYRWVVLNSSGVT